MYRTMLRLGALAVLSLQLGLTETHARSVVEEQVIKIEVRKFEYDRPEIILKKGVPVVFELTSLDRVHGFNIPDFKTRVDVVPGMVTRVRIVPDRAGTFVFFCDVFCGEGHDNMSGEIIVNN